MKYSLLLREPDSMEDSVQELLKEGWKPLGAPFFSGKYRSRRTCSGSSAMEDVPVLGQALVKKGD